MGRLSSWIFFSTLAVSLAWGLPVRAADDEAAEAEALYKSGMADMEAKRYESACPALRKSFRLDAKPKTLFHLAECEERAGRVTTAAAIYDDYLTRYDRLSRNEQLEELEREEQASKRREALEKDLPKVTFVLPVTAPEGTRVLRKSPDGGDPVPLAVGVPLPIDPGEHYVMIDSPNRARLDRRFFINKGENKTVELEVAPSTGTDKPSRFVKPVEPVPTYLPPLNPGMPARRVAAYVIGGVGVAGVLVGAITGAVTWGQKSPIDENCSGKFCNADGEAAKDLAAVSGTVSTVSWAVGLAGIATSAVLFLTEPKKAKLGATPRGFSAGVSSRGLGGASLEMQWQW